MTEPAKSPQKKTPRFRTTKRVALLGLAAFVVGILTFPLWSVWLVKPLASYAGVEIAIATAPSWDRWRLSGIAYRQPGVNATASVMEMPSATQLIFDYLSSEPGSQDLVLQDWVLKLESTPASAEATAPPLTLEALIENVNNATAQVSGLLRSVELRNGIVSIENTETVSIEQLTLTGRELNARLAYLPSSLPIELSASLANPWKFLLEAPQQAVAASFTLTADAEASRLSGTLDSSGNPVSLEAVWPAGQASLLPQTLAANAQQFTLDSRYSAWGDAPALQIDGQASWQNGSFRYQLLGHEQAASTDAPQIRLAGSGDLEQVSVDSAQIDLPWLRLNSRNPIRIDPSFATPPSDAEITAQIILDELPFLEAKGSIEANLKTRSTPDNKPIVSGTLSGSGIGFHDTSIQSLRGRIELNANLLSIDQLELLSAQSSRLAGSAQFDLTAQTILQSRFSVDLKNESALLSSYAPGLDWTSIVGELEVSGPFSDPNVAGTLLSEQLSLPGIVPFDSTAELSGSLKNLSAWLSARNPSSTLRTRLTTGASEDQRTLTLSELTLVDTESTSLLTLAEPATISIQTSDSSISLPSLYLLGEGAAKLTLQGLALNDNQLALQIEGTQLSSHLAQSWLLATLPDLSIESLSADLRLDATDAQLSAAGVANWAIDDSTMIDLAWDIASRPEGSDTLNVNRLEISSDQRPILTAQGKFPISLAWENRSLTAAVQADAPINFTLQSSPRPRFWASVSEVLPINIRKPLIDAKLSGTLEKPEGSFEVALESLEWSDPEDPTRTLNLQNLSASLRADSRALAIERLQASVGKNTLRATARLPLPEVDIASLLSDPRQLDPQLVEAQLQIELSELESLQTLLPGIIRPIGSANVLVDIKNKQVSARGTIKDFATRPFPPLAPLAQISGEFLYEDGVFSTNGLRGLADKSPFTLSGSANLATPQEPRFDLHFKSARFPLVREDGLLIRGDIDLSILTDDSGTTKIGGDLLLTEGLALIEPDLLASSTTTVSARPPYFSVEAEPFNKWELDLHIRGEEFLRVSNSYFQGTLSAEFALEGNLGTPLLIGKGETNTGRIFFPASSLKIRSGEAFITRDRPSELQIQASASGRLFAYDVNLEVQGTADNPKLIITSNPALTQVEALLLLTTGAVPDQSGSLAQQSATSLGVFIGKGLFKKLTGGNKESSSRLEVEVGRDISLQGKKTLEASYELSETLEVEGEYDKRDEFNGNLKWTIYKR